MAAPASLPGQLLLDRLPRTSTMTMDEWSVLQSMGAVDWNRPFAVTGAQATAGEEWIAQQLRAAFLQGGSRSFLPTHIKAPHCRPTHTRKYGYEMTMTLG